MKIIQVTPFLLPSEGGTQRAVIDLSKELVGLGHKVSVFTYNVLDKPEMGPICSSSMKSREEFNQIDIQRFSYSYLASAGLKFSASLSFSLLRSLAKRKADIVHFQGFFHLPNIVLGSFCGKITNTPTVLTTHGLQEAMFDYSHSRNHFVRILAARTIKSVLENIDSFIALSQLDMQVLKDLGLESSKIYCVPNGVDIDKFSNVKLTFGVLQKYGVPSTGPLVLCVCRISRNKGLYYLLQATSKLKNMIDNLSVLIVGPSRDKAYKNWLVEMAINLGVADIVHFRENVPDDDLVRLYSQADLFVLPSEQETLPLVVLEAMAAGCPLIATSVGGIPDIVVNGENGMLIDPGNVEEIVEGVSMLLSDDSLRKRLAEQGRRTARDCSWKNIALRTVDVYSKSLSG